LRSRWAILAAALLLTFITTAPAFAASHSVLAQEDSSDGSGQSDADPATGSEEDASAPAEPETGPPWTFQMAWISIGLAILLALAIFRWYWKLVGSRQKGTA
jgi:hypothetical protein